MQFGTPMFLSGEQFGGLAAPMCAETLEEFKRRLGSRSPTQEDAMRYLMVSTAVQEALTPPDMEKYRQAILLMKGPAANAGRASAENSIQEIERKILGGTEREKAKTWRDNYGESVSGLRPLNVGTPVRLKSDATRHGVVDDEWKVSGVACEYLLNVRFSGGAGGGGEPEGLRAEGKLLVELLLQLSRVCIWAAFSDALDGANGSHALTVAALDAGRGNPAALPRMLSAASVHHLYRVLSVLHLRPVWVALDKAERAPENSSFRRRLQPLVEKLLGGESGYMATASRAAQELIHLRRVEDAQGWHQLLLGGAVVASNGALGLVDDLSDETLSDILCENLANSALSAWCSEE